MKTRDTELNKVVLTSAFQQRGKALLTQFVQQRATELFTLHWQLAMDVGFHYATSRRKNIDDIQNAASSILAELAIRWNDPLYSRHYRKDRGKSERGWMAYCIIKMLGDQFGRERQWKNSSVPFSVLGRAEKEGNFIAPVNRFEKLLQNLGDDALEIVQTILNAPAEIAEDIRPDLRWQRKGAAAIHRWFLGLGWSKHRVAVAWNEIAAAI